MLGPIFIFHHFRFTLTMFYTEVMLKKKQVIGGLNFGHMSKNHFHCFIV